MKAEDIHVGLKVTYLSDVSRDFGIVKSIKPNHLPETDPEIAFVVYACDDDWDNWQKYTGVATLIKDLREGWELEPVIEPIDIPDEYANIQHSEYVSDRNIKELCGSCYEPLKEGDIKNMYIGVGLVSMSASIQFCPNCLTTYNSNITLTSYLPPTNSI